MPIKDFFSPGGRFLNHLPEAGPVYRPIKITNIMLMHVYLRFKMLWNFFGNGNENIGNPIEAPLRMMRALPKFSNYGAWKLDWHLSLIRSSLARLGVGNESLKQGSGVKRLEI